MGAAGNPGGVASTPYGPMQELNPQPFRIKRVILGGVALAALILLIAPPVCHTAMIWLNHGTWCVQLKADGTTLIKYGAKACGM
jgi:hypothetical protein